MNEIKAIIQLNGKSYEANLKEPLDISIELSAEENPRAWYVDLPKITPVMTEHFTGSVELGGAVNFRDIFFNPHGHGTHTECAGHITKEIHSVNDSMRQFFSDAQLISVTPKALAKNDRFMKKGDLVIQVEDIEKALSSNPEALIIRTLPNALDKKTRNYSASNPPYIHPEAMKLIADSSVKHLLLDLPSVDREMDEGLLTGHHLFWQTAQKTNLERTITEMIYVPDAILDGMCLLELQVAPFKNDASPSRPVLYRLSLR